MKIGELLRSEQPVLLHLSTDAKNAGHGSDFVRIVDANELGLLVAALDEPHPTRPAEMFYPWAHVVGISRGVERWPVVELEADRFDAPTAGQRAKKSGADHVG